MAEFEKAEELVVGLYDRGAIKFSDFEWTLKSGRQSPLYYNQRPLTSVDNASHMSYDAQLHVLDLAVEGYASAADGIEHTHSHIYGIPQAGTAIGALAARALKESYLWGRVGKKVYGAHADIEGHFQPGESVAQIDDVITNADSKLESAESLSRVSLDTAGFVVMFDREEGGREKVEEAGFQLIAVTGLAQALQILKSNQRIGNQEIDWIARYHEGLRNDGLL